MMKKIRIVLADDHNLVRAGIRRLLESIKGVEVVAEADNGRRALTLMTEHRPDIAFVDIAMPELNGLEVISRAQKEVPHVRVVVLSMHASEEYVLESLRAGAAGYLLKDADVEELESAVRTVMKGGRYLCSVVSRTVIDEYVRRVAATSQPVTRKKDPFHRLTSRQREILQLIAEGKSTKEIAARLNVSIKTVDAHRTELMKRLRIHDIAGLVRYAIREGLVSPER